MNTLDDVAKQMSRFNLDRALRLRDVVVSSHAISRERELVRLCSPIVPAVQIQDDIPVFE